MKRKLRTQLSVGFVLIALIIIALISLSANILINRQFEKYIASQQKTFSDNLAQNLKFQYDTTTKTWNVDYIHGVGMYALNDGYIIKLSDALGKTVWDAQNHDMKQCHQLMQSIAARMKAQRPQVHGDFVKHNYTLKDGAAVIGHVTISYYSPYYLNEDAFQFLDSLNLILLIIGIFSIVGAAFAALILARRLSTPITNTIEATRAISEGNYQIRIAEKTQTAELAELEQSVNQMANALDKQESLRKQLTTDIAHELRTPLANVSAQLEMMLEGVWQPTPERLQSGYDEIGRITQLVDGLQRLSQAENDHLTLERTPVDVYELAQLAARDFEHELEVRKLTCSVTGESVIVSADRNRLHQVFTNLISNALKYSESGGSISIEVTDNKDTCIIKVLDTGIGIDEEDLPFIFERFYRTDKSRSRATGGTGIGLTIVASIIAAHGGTIAVNSTLGAGTTFTITLPKDSASIV